MGVLRLTAISTSRLVAAALTALLTVGCTAGVSSPSPAQILTIASPHDGDVVATQSIQVRGTAPAGAEIVQDISFAPDKRTSADANGNWVLTVDLDPGENDLTFRIGSDDATGKTIRIVYGDSGSAASSPTPDTSPSTTSSATARPSTPRPATPVPTPSPLPTPTPTPSPVPTPKVATFGGGDQIVGTDVQPGTYRTRQPANLCYWERLSGFGGSLDEVIANGAGSGYFTVTIAAGDLGFSSSGCGTWSADLSAVTSPAGPIDEDGVYIVGTDIAPGTWKSTGGAFGCYVARLSGFGGTLDDVITNDVSSDGGLIVTIASSDKGFETSGCGTWTKVK